MGVSCRGLAVMGVMTVKILWTVCRRHGGMRRRLSYEARHGSCCRRDDVMFVGGVHLGERQRRVFDVDGGLSRRVRMWPGYRRK